MPWYVQPDDMIGGWCIMTVNKPPGESDYRSGEWQIASFMAEGVAQHVATLHNDWRAGGSPL